MAFRKKADRLLDLNPDVAVILESESDQKIDFSKHSKVPFSKLWYGDNPNKGVLVASYNPSYKISLHPKFNPEFRYVLPIVIEDNSERFVILAVWTQKTESIYTSYVVQACRAIEYYKELLSEKSIVLGDFNSNKIWDDGDKKEFNHSDLVRLLSSCFFVSMYHQHKDEAYGKEMSPTLYLQKKHNKPYHVDYIFAHNSQLGLIKAFSLGGFDDWIELSDHMPMYIDI